MSAAGFHADPSEITSAVAELVLPPSRMLPSEVAARYLRNEHGPWTAETAPYMVEPLDAVAGRHYQGIALVGPARTGKTFGLILAAMAYCVTSAPADMLITHMTKDTARDFSMGDLAKAFRYSPELAKRLSNRNRDNNVFDLVLRSGMILKMGWPAISQLSGKTLRFVCFTDYDRVKVADNLGGEGTMWVSGLKRVTTYMSRGKCLVESSPGYEWDLKQADWVPSTPHEGPPTSGGIVQIYNSSTRARWYWTCLHCNWSWMVTQQPSFFGVPDFDECRALVRKNEPADLAAKYAIVGCPKCGAVHRPEERSRLNSPEGGALWVHDGEIVESGRIVGGRRRPSNTAGYWLGAAAAAYQTWENLLLRYFQAVKTYEDSVNEGDLKAVVLTDFGDVYKPRILHARQRRVALKDRYETWEKGFVPAGVRYLTAAVDVQGNRFVVEVHGWAAGRERWIIARFMITTSRRTGYVATQTKGPQSLDQERGGFWPIATASYDEDWDLLQEFVMNLRFPLAENANTTMSPLLTVVDSGGGGVKVKWAEGEISTTMRAYSFWRRMRDRGLGRRVMLVRGFREGPLMRETWPDHTGNDSGVGQTSDVPVWQLNSNQFKSSVRGALERLSPGPGYFHVPDWIDEQYERELYAETLTAKGWENLGRQRNEAGDLAYYNLAAAMIVAPDDVDWTNPPPNLRRPTVDDTPIILSVERAPPSGVHPTLVPSVGRRPGNYLQGR